MKTIRIIYPGSFRFLSMSAEAADYLIKELENRPPGAFYTQGFEKSIRNSIIMLPPQYRKTVEETEPDRTMISGSILSLPNIDYEIDFKQIGSSHFIRKF